MADLELVGDDGIRVPALRCVLACASPILHNLLYGDPSRASQSVVKISGCSNKTLRALVEYCCSDELNASIWDGSCPPAEIVKDIVALARVSHAYGIPNMEERVLEGINPLMGAIPPLACVVFNYADPETTKAIYNSALSLIREKPYTCLQQEGQNVGGMVCLSPNKLKGIIRDTALQVDELFLFKQLVRWRSFNRNIYSNATAVCKQLVTYIDLTYIDPSDIKAIVLDSGLFEDRAIIEALLEQSISATREGLAFAAMRGASGKEQVYAMVQGVSADINGLYKQVQKEGTLLCYGKMVDEKRMILLVKDSRSSWKICDNENLFYEWRSASTSHYDQFPVTGWVNASRIAGTGKPVPTVKWFRPRGASPRLPSSASRPSSISSIPPKSRAPVLPFDPRESPGESSLSTHDHLLAHPEIRQHQSMDEHDRRQAPSPTNLASRMRPPPSHLTSRHPTDSSSHLHQQHHLHYSSQHAHQHQHLFPSRSMKDEYHSHHRTSSPHEPLAMGISPRTPSPRLGFTAMPSVKESVSWAI